MRSGRTVAFVALLAVCGVGAAAYVRHAMQRAGMAADSVGRGLGDAAAVTAGPTGIVLLWRSTARDASYGRLALGALDEPGSRRLVSTLACERVDFAGGRGVCLAAERGMLTTYAAIVFDREFRPLARLVLAGPPSRVRVAPDGRLAAVTVFVSGHGYGGAFSTVTSVIDLERGEYLVPNFEALTVTHRGAPFDAVDRNFWGVTFASDSDSFYATVGSGGRTHLVSGRVSGRAASLVRDDIECPSLSPDYMRVAFKRRVGRGGEPVRWRLSVLELATMTDRALAETRSVDDQAAWLDDRRVMYSLPDGDGGTPETTTWVVDADGAGAPRPLLGQASSTVVFAAARANR